MKYDGINFISYHHLPLILFISFLKYPNNWLKYLFHSASSHSIPLYSVLFCSIPLYSINTNRA
jgi:hypothetical protein